MLLVCQLNKILLFYFSPLRAFPSSLKNTLHNWFNLAASETSPTSYWMLGWVHALLYTERHETMRKKRDLNLKKKEEAGFTQEEAQYRTKPHALLLAPLTSRPRIGQVSPFLLDVERRGEERRERRGGERRGKRRGEERGEEGEGEKERREGYQTLTHKACASLRLLLCG